VVGEVRIAAERDAAGQQSLGEHQQQVADRTG
jgi:hypothetical protein